MASLLKVREKLIVLYKNHETVAHFALKLLAGLIMFSGINSVVYYNEAFAGIVTMGGGMLYVLGLSVLFAVAPPTTAHLILLLAVVVQTSLSLELALIIFLAGVLALVFYCRLDPKRSFLITAILLGFYFKIPYSVVLFTGLYIGLAGIIPVTIGTAIWSLIPVFTNLVGLGHVTDITELTDVSSITTSFSDIYISIQGQITGDLQWLYTAFIFAMTVVLVYAVSRLSINYAKELSLALGGFLCILGGVLAAGLGNGGSVAGVIVFTLLSVVLVLGIKLFDLALNYKKVEYVEFEDETSFYYVKIISKLTGKPPKEDDAPIRPRTRPERPPARRGSEADAREEGDYPPPPPRRRR